MAVIHTAPLATTASTSYFMGRKKLQKKSDSAPTPQEDKQTKWTPDWKPSVSASSAYLEKKQKQIGTKSFEVPDVDFVVYFVCCVVTLIVFAVVVVFVVAAVVLNSFAEYILPNMPKTSGFAILGKALRGRNKKSARMVFAGLFNLTALLSGG